MMNESNISVMQADPVFKIIFRDELTSRKYRRRLEDIINYVLTSKLNDETESDLDAVSDLTLQFYDPTECERRRAKAEQQPLSHWQERMDDKISCILGNESKKRKIEEEDDDELDDVKVKREKEEAESSTKPAIKTSEPSRRMFQNNTHYTSESEPEDKKVLKKPKRRIREASVSDSASDYSVVDVSKRRDEVGETKAVKLAKQETPQPQSAKCPELSFLQVRSNMETAFKNMISLRIGVSDYFIKDKNLYFANDTGLTIRHKGDEEVEIVNIKLCEIVKILAHLPKVKPSIFIFVTQEAMRRVYASTGISNKKEGSVDQRIRDTFRNCLTILPDLMNVKANNIFREIFKYNQLVDIEDGTAKDLMAAITSTTAKGKASKADKFFKNFVEKCGKYLPKNDHRQSDKNTIQLLTQQFDLPKAKVNSIPESSESTNVPQPKYQEYHTPTNFPSQQQQPVTHLPPPQLPTPPPPPLLPTPPPQFSTPPPQLPTPPPQQLQTPPPPQLPTPPPSLKEQHQQHSSASPSPVARPGAVNQTNNAAHHAPGANENNPAATGATYETAEAIFCRVIRVGSHEYAKKRMFSITKNGIKFCVPHPASSAMITLGIKIHDITKILIGSSKSLPVLFIYIYPKLAEDIRSVLRMSDPSGPYIDPLSKDETQNKIIILPEKQLNNYLLLEKLSTQSKIQYLDEPTTNDLLSRSLPSNIDLFHKLSKKEKKPKVKQEIKEEKVEITLW